MFSPSSLATLLRFLNEILDFIIRHVLSKLLGYPLEVFKRNLSCFIVVEEPERFQHFFTRISLSHFLGHHIKEFREVNHTTTIAVSVCNHFSDFLFLWLETESSHGNLEL